ATALAAYMSMPVNALPDALERVLALHGEWRTRLVVLDPDAATASLDEKWFRPAWQALMRGDIALVTVVSDDRSGALVWNAKHPTMWQRLALRFRAPDRSTVFTAQPD